MLRRPPRSTLFPTRRSSDLREPISNEERAAPNKEKQHDGSCSFHAWENPTLARQQQYHSGEDRKSTRLNSSHTVISYAVFCLKKKKNKKKVIAIKVRKESSA